MGAPLQQKSPQRQEVGPTVGIFIVVLLLLIGGVYFLVSQEMKLHSQPNEAQVNS